ncbi:21465_t:CDS:1, partial [Gigaspora margarita]
NDHFPVPEAKLSNHINENNREPEVTNLDPEMYREPDTYFPKLWILHL